MCYAHSGSKNQTDLLTDSLKFLGFSFITQYLLMHKSKWIGLSGTRYDLHLLKSEQIQNNKKH